MKRITTFFFLLLFALTLQGQKVLTSGGKVLTYDGKVLIQNYVPESEAIFAAMGTQPSDARKRIIDNLVRGLKDDGIWDILDFLYVLAAHAENSSLINWLNPGTFDATNVHSTAYTVDQGYTGDGANDYLNTNYNPNTDGINYLQDDASAGVYVMTNVDEAARDFGGNDGANFTYILPRLANNTWIRLNAAGASSVANIDSRGFFIISRLDATDDDCYKNKVKIIDGSTAPSGLPNVDFYILKENGDLNESTKQIAAAFAGGGQTQTNVTNFTNRIETYMDAIGAGVISEMMWLILLLIPNVRRKEFEYKIAA